MRRWSTFVWLVLFCLPACGQVMLMIGESADPVVAGDGSGNLVYTLSVQSSFGYGNAVMAGAGIGIDIDIGGEPALIDVTLVMPEGVSLDSATVSSGSFTGFDSNGVGTWDVSAPMFSVELMTVTLTVASNAADGAVASLEAQNQGQGEPELVIATVSSDLDLVQDIGDISMGGGIDYAFEDTTIERQVDLQLSFAESADPFPAGTGEQLDITVTLLNAGPSDASNVEIALTYGATGGGSIVSESGNGGNFTPGSGGATWSFASLPAGSSGDASLAVEHGKLGLSGAVTLVAGVNGVDENTINTGDDALNESTTLEVFKDADRDGLADAFELSIGTDPLVKDSDGDGAEDGIEVAFGLFPLDDTQPANTTDSDGDLIPDDIELANGLDPTDSDENGDGRRDGYDAAFSGASAVSGTTPFGDVNRDGSFNFLDVRLIYLAARTGQAPATTSEPLIDIDRDGMITISDMMLALYVLRGLGGLDLVPTQ